jgi:hypothetical protein
MNLTELKRQIDAIYESHRYPDEVKVVIPVVRLNAIGPSGSVSVDNLYMGFDWDDNTLFITPESELREIDRDEIGALVKEYNIVVTEAMRKRK